MSIVQRLACSVSVECVWIIAVQGESMGNQQTEALLHTSLPSIRTKLKQRPGKRKSALTPPSIAQLPWMQEWIATGVPDALEYDAFHISPAYKTEASAVRAA